jgi:hypothetical protein
MDNRKNNFGNRLLELCRCNNIFICNGRIGDDKGIGKFTSKNVSVVELVLKSNNSFSISLKGSPIQYLEFSGGTYTIPNKTSRGR